MNWEAIGAIGEIAGATAVIVSLIYVALQILANTRAMRFEAMRSIRTDGGVTFKLIASDPVVALLTLKSTP